MSELLANYHTHTFRCHHATGTEREYIEAAISSGIKTLGFSEHIPYILDGGYEAQYSMWYRDVEDYFKTLNALKDEYEKEINIRIGFEAEYYPKYFDENLEKLKQYNPEYLILGQHFVDNGESNYMGRIFTSEDVLKKYVNTVIEGIKTKKFTYIAHPDLPYFIGTYPIFENEMRRLCKAAKETSTPLEFNILGFAKLKNYPSDTFVKVAKEVGNDLIFGLDAHCVEQISDLRDVYDARQYLKDNYSLTPIEDIKLIDPYKN